VRVRTGEVHQLVAVVPPDMVGRLVVSPSTFEHDTAAGGAHSTPAGPGRDQGDDGSAHKVLFNTAQGADLIVLGHAARRLLRPIASYWPLIVVGEYEHAEGLRAGLPRSRHRHPRACPNGFCKSRVTCRAGAITVSRHGPAHDEGRSRGLALRGVGRSRPVFTRR
jgi:hypothetical protein